MDIDALVPRTKAHLSSDVAHPETDTSVNLPKVESKMECNKYKLY